MTPFSALPLSLLKSHAWFLPTLLIGAIAAAATGAEQSLRDTPVGQIATQHAYLLSQNAERTKLWVVQTDDQQRGDVLQATAEPGVVSAGSVGKRVRLRARVINRQYHADLQRVVSSLKIESVAAAIQYPLFPILPSSAKLASSRPPTTLAGANTLIDLTTFQGVTLVAIRDLDHVDRFRSLGITDGFGNGQPISDFIARKQYVTEHGTVIKKGDRFVIDQVQIKVQARHTGSKLILRSAEPRAGLAFYCYGYDRSRDLCWPIDLASFKKTVAGYFRVEPTESEVAMHDN